MEPVPVALVPMFLPGKCLPALAPGWGEARARSWQRIPRTWRKPAASVIMQSADPGTWPDEMRSLKTLQCNHLPLETCHDWT